jgi:hypothetical protein
MKSRRERKRERKRKLPPRPDGRELALVTGLHVVDELGFDWMSRCLMGRVVRHYSGDWIWYWHGKRGEERTLFDAVRAYRKAQQEQS